MGLFDLLLAHKLAAGSSDALFVVQVQMRSGQVYQYRQVRTVKVYPPDAVISQRGLVDNTAASLVIFQPDGEEFIPLSNVMSYQILPQKGGDN